MFFFHQKTTFFSFVFVKNLFFHKAASLSALLELNVKKSTRGRIAIFLDIFSARARTLLKEQRILRSVFLYHCLSLCVRTVCPALDEKYSHTTLSRFSVVVLVRHHSIWAACSVICEDFQSHHREQRRESLEDRNKRNYSQNDEGKNLSRSFSNDDDP